MTMPSREPSPASSIHDKLQRVVGGRTHIIYHVENTGAGGGLISRELPFVVGVLGDFSGSSTQPLKPLRERPFVLIHRDNFDDILASMTPGLKLSVSNLLEEGNTELSVNLSFRCLDDFKPANLAGQIEPLRNLLYARTALNDLLSWLKAGEPPAKILELMHATVARVSWYLPMIRGDLPSALAALISWLDDGLSRQLAAVMHAPAFQKLEGAWRGLHYLVMNTESSSLLQLKVLNVSKKELFFDLERALDFDQSQIFRKVYENEFGRADGEPYGVLLGDYEFSNYPEDLDLLRTLSNVAGEAFCPFIAAASPKLFGFETGWCELSRPQCLESIFNQVEYTKWRSFRDFEDARFVCLVLPRVLARLPYGATTAPVEEFQYEEVDASKPVPDDSYLWMNAAYVHATKLTEAFARHGQCIAIHGREGGGKVEGLPMRCFQADDGMEVKCGTEVEIDDRREAELNKLGFLPLMQSRYADYAVFFGCQTAHRPRKYDMPSASANMAIFARLPCILATARFVHYLKVMARDKIGSLMEVADCQDWLQKWIKQYVDSTPNADRMTRARKPLGEAVVLVKEDPGQPGSYHIDAYLRPWLPFEELVGARRLVARIPASP
jgi:type VI secretion system protein ImpC